MIYGSVCSGIEAASVAWEPLGWKPAFFSEIESFPRQLLKWRYPDVPLHGDFTTIRKKDYGTINLLVGGTPCQDYSVAGGRKGLAGDGGNLALEFASLAERKNADWFLWENVPGVLSSGIQFDDIEDGDFSRILFAFRERGYSVAWRVLDSQYFGVPQSRRRLFLVGYRGSWRYPAAVLFERESLQGNASGKQKKRKRIAGTTEGGAEKKLIAYNVTFSDKNGTRKDRPNGGLYIAETTIANTLTASGNSPTFIIDRGRVRRLTILEWERLQGFPDGYTDVPYRANVSPPDSLRFEVIGNSMAVPVMRWLGERIQQVQQLIEEEKL